MCTGVSTGAQPESAIWTLTICAELGMVESVTAMATLIGVTFPVFTPSTQTSAADGNEVTLSVPLAARATDAQPTRKIDKSVKNNPRMMISPIKLADACRVTVGCVSGVDLPIASHRQIDVPGTHQFDEAILAAG
jgi:hypothetical protein